MERVQDVSHARLDAPPSRLGPKVHLLWWSNFGMRGYMCFVLCALCLLDDVSFGGCLRGGVNWDGVPATFPPFDDDVFVGTCCMKVSACG
jgi:hypothetical protein